MKARTKFFQWLFLVAAQAYRKRFLLALQRTLSDNDMFDVMPETNYKAAISVIERWETEFPDTYRAFEAAIDTPVPIFVNALASYDIAAYEQFERVYPSLTAGSVF